MAYPDLPASAKEMTASSAMRWRHRYWHLVKNRNFVDNPANSDLVEALKNIGWTSATTGEPGGGLDFLFMHRMMIKNIDEELAGAGDPAWPKVVAWPQIPPGANDPDWPEPEIANIDDPASWPADLQGIIQAIAQARSAAVVSQNLQRAEIFRDPGFLTRPETTLDQYGFLIEATVHNWMHMRFAASPPDDFNDTSVANDWLGQPFSSHVNSYFWKLHGWIDDCITIWEQARGEVADFSTAWRPPTEAPPADELLDDGSESLVAEAILLSLPMQTTFQTSPELAAKAESILNN